MTWSHDRIYGRTGSGAIHLLVGIYVREEDT